MQCTSKLLNPVRNVEKAFEQRPSFHLTRRGPLLDPLKAWRAQNWRSCGILPNRFVMVRLNDSLSWSALTSVNLSFARESRLWHLGVYGVILPRHSRDAVSQGGQCVVGRPAFVGGHCIAACIHWNIVEGGVVAACCGLLPPSSGSLPSSASALPPASPPARPLGRGEFSQAKAKS